MKRDYLTIIAWLLVVACLGVFLFSDCSRGDSSVVRIRWQAQDGGSFIVSGTIIERRGQCAYVLTCWHGSRDAANPEVLIGEQPYQAVVTDFDTLQDLLMLEIADSGVPHAKLADTEPRIGDCVWIAGHGQGTYRKSGGLVTQFVWPDPPTDCRVHRSTHNAGEGPATFLECRAVARGGDSGGPILNSKGDVVGVVCGTSRGTSCGPCLPRLRGWLGRCVPQKTPITRPLVQVPPPIVRIPIADPPPRTSDPETLILIAELRAEIAVMRSALNAPPIPGPPGPPGKDGKDGIDGAAATAPAARYPVFYDIVPKRK